VTSFYLIAAALVVVAVVALLRPLMRRAGGSSPDVGATNLQILREQRAELDAELAGGSLSAEQHAMACAELERRVLEEAGATVEPAAAATAGTASAVSLALAIPLLAGGLYLALGNPMALDPVLRKPAEQATAADVEVLVERLAQRMQKQPDDPAGWALLARTYAALQRFEPARDAYKRALALDPKNAGLLADYADALAMTLGRKLAGEPEQRVLEALAIDPNHLKALALAGSAAMERGDMKAAVGFWTRARDVAPPDSPFLEGVNASLREARAAAGLPPETTAVARAAPAPAAATGAKLSVQVSLAPGLASRVQPGDTLFVFARAAEGPRMPLAIARHRADELPLTVTLDDAMAMRPELKLSSFDRVVVGARISRSGNAAPQSGDLEGQSAAVPPSGSTAVTIDQTRP
jgi:cytochrome c-type biogenesis protein CcmH